MNKIVVQHRVKLNIYNYELSVTVKNGVYSGKLLKETKVAASSIQGRDLPSIIYTLWVIAYTIDKR